MIIDIHTHAFADPVAAAAMASLEAEVGFAGSYDGTVAGLVAQMDGAGVDIAVVQPVATKASQVARINDWAASIASDRVVAFGALHPDLEDPAAEIERMVGLGLVGCKMHPEYQSFDPDEPRMLSLLRAARDAGLVVLFHAGADLSIPSLRGTPQAFARMLEAVDGLRVILAHMGGYDVWDDVLVHLAGRDVYFDTAYTLGHLSDEAFVHLARAHGTERILFGTDGPWTNMAEQLERIRELPFSADEFEAILGGNARRALGFAEGETP